MIGILIQRFKKHYRLAREVLGRSPKHILLLHENDLAALFIGDLISKIREEGWKIISPVEAYQDQIATMIPDTLQNNQGRVGAIAAARSYKKPLSHPSENQEYIDRLYAENQVFE